MSSRRDFVTKELPALAAGFVAMAQPAEAQQLPPNVVVVPVIITKDQAKAAANKPENKGKKSPIDEVVAVNRDVAQATAEAGAIAGVAGVDGGGKVARETGRAATAVQLGGNLAKRLPFGGGGGDNEGAKFAIAALINSASQGGKRDVVVLYASQQSATSLASTLKDAGLVTILAVDPAEKKDNSSFGIVKDNAGQAFVHLKGNVQPSAKVDSVGMAMGGIANALKPPVPPAPLTPAPVK